MSVHPVGDVRDLPQEVFGRGNITWWAALGSEIIEGFVLVLLVFSYFYLRHQAPDWPPPHTRLPSLGVPSVNLLLMGVSIAPAWLAARAARGQDRRRTALWLLLHVLVGLAIVALRYHECKALNVRWDSNAYGSITWAILFSHGYMALFDVFDTIGLLVLAFFTEPEEKHYADVVDNSFFWYFVIATWIPLFVIVFLVPRWT